MPQILEWVEHLAGDPEPEPTPPKHQLTDPSEMLEEVKRRYG